MIKKCRIQKYDPNVLEPPYEFITLVDLIEIVKPDNDPGGSEFAFRLWDICDNLGYDFRFYSTSDVEGIDFDITVRGELEDKLKVW